MSTLRVGTIQSTGGTNALIIDSSGRVNRSVIPAFFTQRGYGLTSGFMSGNTTAITTWNSTLYNSGNHFNAATGRFTAPIAGLYVFSYMICHAGGANISDFRFYINGTSGYETTVIKRSAADVNLWLTANQTTEMNLAANDYVTVGVISYEGNGGSIRASFSGHFIG